MRIPRSEEKQLKHYNIENDRNCVLIDERQGGSPPRASSPQSACGLCTLYPAQRGGLSVCFPQARQREQVAELRLLAKVLNITPCVYRKPYPS
jgi:hypothetical protein